MVAVRCMMLAEVHLWGLMLLILVDSGNQELVFKSSPLLHDFVA